MALKLTHTKDEIQKSRTEALEKIRKLLDVPDVEAQFDKISGDYHSTDKFIVSWLSNHHKIASETSIDKTDGLYQSMSGYKAIKATRSLIHEKQLKGYPTIERALLEVGLELCSSDEEKKDFFNKFVTPYNQKLKKDA